MDSRWIEAEPLLRECLRLREKKGPDDWFYYLTQSQLGAALAGQKRHAEAEPLLVRGYEGLKAREAKIAAPRRTDVAEATARIVPFYAAWGKPDKADEWRKRLAPASQK